MVFNIPHLFALLSARVTEVIPCNVPTYAFRSSLVEKNIVLIVIDKYYFTFITILRRLFRKRDVDIVCITCTRVDEGVVKNF